MYIDLDQVDRRVVQPAAPRLCESRRMVQFGVRVRVKTHYGSFGSKFTSDEDFAFCCESADVARELASGNVKSQGWPHDDKILHVHTALPVWC